MSKKIGYYLKKLLNFIISIVILSMVLFVISRNTPMDPLQSYYGERVEKMSVEEKDRAREKLGLNQPLAKQYLIFVKNALKGDFGRSYKYKQDVVKVIGNRLPNTLLLGGLGFVLIFLGALLSGILCAIKEDGIFDRSMCSLGTIFSCIPEFWLSLSLIFIFCVILRLLPSSGAYTVGGAGDVEDRIRHLLLPLFVVVQQHIWYYGYMIRNQILEEMKKDYFLFYRSLGFSKWQVLTKHCIRNILPSYLSLMAIAVPHILGGTYIVEMVFSYPGIGSLSYESARFADYNLLMVLAMLTGMTVIFFGMVSQIINEKINPYLQMDKKEPQEEGKE